MPATLTKKQKLIRAANMIPVSYTHLLMTRYEMAQIVAKAMAKGAIVDTLAAEFADQLDSLGVRVAALEKDVYKRQFVVCFQRQAVCLHDLVAFAAVLFFEQRQQFGSIDAQ